MELKAQKPKHINLTKENLSLIKSFATPFSYNINATLFYENQIPLVAYVLVEGEILLTKSRRKSLQIPIKSLIGLTEIIQDIPSLHAAKIKQGSKVYFLDKSSIQELLNHVEEINGDLRKFLSNLETV